MKWPSLIENNIKLKRKQKKWFGRIDYGITISFLTFPDIPTTLTALPTPEQQRHDHVVGQQLVRQVRQRRIRQGKGIPGLLQDKPNR